MGEPIGEILFGVLSVVAGFALGSLMFVLAHEVWASRRTLRMRSGDQRRREADGASRDGVVDSELAHPRRLVSRTDELAAFAVMFMLAFALLAVVTLFVEVVIVAVAAVAVTLTGPGRAAGRPVLRGSPD